ncbi:CUB and sushi domain-containing protein [Mytilus galloprovincialis]|uniref:CUB and sushi domain-containing protein n=1 Tax=Mytilus galloprovincialis TaxID=29158 RepID=A0A8B6GLH7_MYTGA|nr:CUB and sushi domain-containing protein [Mytilus galloprovincialis]
MTWEAAKVSCEAEGMELVTYKSLTEFSNIYSSERYWLGTSWKPFRQQFQWVDGTLWSINDAIVPFKSATEPNCLEGYESCASNQNCIYLEYSKFGSQRCSNTYQSLCQTSTYKIMYNPIFTTCTSPTSIINAATDTTVVKSPGEMITYTCDFGYELSNGQTSWTRECGVDGSWTTDSNVCVVITCTSPPTIINAVTDTTVVKSPGQMITYTCDFGYELPGGQTSWTRECGVDGNWTTDSYVCVVKQCKAPPAVSNSNHNTVAVIYPGEKITYTCGPGYYMSNGQTVWTRLCEWGGTWAMESNSCSVITCSSPPTVINAVTDTTVVKSPGGMITYTCDFGYELSDGQTSWTRECGVDGNWTTDSNVCIVKQCITPPAVSNSNHNTIAVIYPGEKITYTCDTGFYTSNGQTVWIRFCEWGGIWALDTNSCSVPVVTEDATTMSVTTDPPVGGCSCNIAEVPNTSPSIQTFSSFKVEVKTTSAYRRSLVSAPDDRVSSAVIGYMGVFILCLVLAVPLLFDVLNIFSKE